MPHHHFEPDTYYINMGSHPPVLAVDPGDTITTRTIDARGGDYLGKTVSPPSNPQTGPFFVNGAEPGDSLVFRLDSLRPNRADGFTRAVVAPRRWTLDSSRRSTTTSSSPSGTSMSKRRP